MIVTIAPRVFAQLNLLVLPNPQNPTLYNAFQSLDTPKSAASHAGIYIAM